MPRDTIFIGHATPEDNEFTVWLQSKLQNEGYKCECDLSLLLGGEADYWRNLQDFLEFQTAKYVLVVSETTFSKSGVLDEWEFCKSVEKENNLSDFLIPIKIDHSTFNARIGLNRKNIISCEENWAIGLKRLLKKLKHDNVPKSEASIFSINDWYENAYTNWSGIDNEQSDIFFSNWIKIPQLPENMYFYKFYNEDQAKAVLANNIVYTAFRHGNFIVTFQKSLNYFLSDENLDIEPTEIVIKKTQDAFIKYQEDIFPTYHDFRRLLVRLLKDCVEGYLIGKDLVRFELSNSSCYFFEHKPDDKAKGRFVVKEKTKNIGITGKYYDAFWHYALSFRPLLYPELSFVAKNHIIFTEDGKKAWDDPKKMHRARRDKGSKMHNKEWRDQLLAYLSSLADNENSEIIIPVAEETNIVLSTVPILFNAPFSYKEPNDPSRLMSIDGLFDDEDFYDSENEEEAHV